MDTLSQARLDNQRDVVRNERRQGLENEPYGRWLTLICENAYPYRHPYANDVIGTHDDLEAATLEDVKDFFAIYYKPNNLSLVIAGDFDPAEARRLVEKYFGGIPAGPALDRPVRWVPELDGERVVEVKDRVPQERTYFAWHSPAFFEQGDAELDLTSAILADGLSARLNKTLVYDRQLCSDTSAFQFSREAGSLFVVTATARPGASLSEVERIVTEEIERLAKQGPAEAELNRAKTKWEFSFVSGLERIGGFGGKADRLNQYNVFLGDPDRFEADLARYRSATVESVRLVVDKWLNTRNRLLVRFHPETSGRESTAEVDRSVQPSLGVDRPFQVPQVQTARLNNGLEVLAVEKPELPKVAVALVSRTGAIHDPQGKSGVAGLTAVTVRMGTRTRKALEIEDALGDLGTTLWGAAERERSQLGLEVLKRNLAPALEILADVVLNPVFPESEVEREKKRRLDVLAQESQDPNAVAFRVGQVLTFGPDHVYGRVELPSTVEKITRDDLERFYTANWKPDHSALIFVGDVTLAEAVELTRKHLGGWSGAAPAPLEISAPQPVGPGRVYLVDRQDAAQTVLLATLPGPLRSSPDYYLLRVADTVLGNGFATRLNLNLREDKGYTYGVYSFTSAYLKAGLWVVSGGFHTDKTKESVLEVDKELKGIAGERPITATELEFAKVSRIRGFAQQFESLGRIGGQVADLWAHRLPMSELQREPAEFEKADLESVNAAARRYGDLRQITIVLVGDLAEVEDDIRGLNMGEMVIVDVEGKPKK
jgi:zinc protease